MTLKTLLTSANAWTVTPICTSNLVPGLGSWGASRARQENSWKNIRIEFFLERMPSLMERILLSRFSLMNSTRFTTAFLKPRTNTLIMHRHRCPLRGVGGFTVLGYPTEIGRAQSEL